MHLGALKLLVAAKDWNQSQIAKMSMVSRQAVSLWFKSEKNSVDIHSSHLIALSDAAGCQIRNLVRAPAGLENPTQRQELENYYNWDRSYKSIESFLVLVARGDLRALSRLVERSGIFVAASIVGVEIWEKFHEYKNFLPPQKRKAAELLWKKQSELALI